MSIVAVIIDDGVWNPAEKEIRRWTVDISSLEVRKQSVQSQKKSSHGDLSFSIIKHYTGDLSIQWHSIQVLDSESHHGNIFALVCALDFCRELHASVVHMSIGSRSLDNFAFKALREAVDRLTQSGAVIVAAASNQGTVTYPACLPNVLGVRVAPSLKGDHYIFCSRPYDGIDFEASAIHVLRDLKTITRFPNNSCAAPLITSHVIKLISQQKYSFREDLIEQLLSTADNADEKSEFCNLPEIISNTKNVLLVTEKDQDTSVLWGNRPYAYMEELDINITSETYQWIICDIQHISPKWSQFISKCLQVSHKIKIAVWGIPEWVFADLRPDLQKRVWCYRPPRIYTPFIRKPTQPIVGFAGIPRSILYPLLKQLSDCFIEEGSLCGVLIDSPDAEIYGYQTFPQEQCTLDFFYTYGHFYQYDIILIGILGEFSLSEALDLFITGTDQMPGDIQYKGQDARCLYAAIEEKLSD